MPRDVAHDKAQYCGRINCHWTNKNLILIFDLKIYCHLFRIIFKYRVEFKKMLTCFNIPLNVLIINFAPFFDDLLVIFEYFPQSPKYNIIVAET